MKSYRDFFIESYYFPQIYKITNNIFFGTWFTLSRKHVSVNLVNTVPFFIERKSTRFSIKTTPLKFQV